jgi:Kef-type K+ transport system membrane component KefB
VNLLDRLVTSSPAADVPDDVPVAVLDDAVDDAVPCAVGVVDGADEQPVSTNALVSTETATNRMGRSVMRSIQPQRVSSIVVDRSAGGDMAQVATSLFWIVLIAVLAPLAAGLVPRRLVPEVVILLVLGMLAGPHVLGLATSTEGIALLRELGLGMLFLLAGYEIELGELTGRLGRRALVTWLVCIVVALGLMFALRPEPTAPGNIAIAIALTSTALGTLLPILKDNGLLGTRFGATVMAHGAFGELGPVVAMALLLSTRGSVLSILVLALFGLAAVAVVWLTRVHQGTALHRRIVAGAETTSQTTVRVVLLMLGSLMLLALAFDLDVVLAAFAAGFILRQALPDGDEALEHKLEGLAYGLLIPVFFVTSGMSIDPAAVGARPWLLVSFVLLIVVVRGGAVFVASRGQRDAPGGPRSFTTRDSVRLGLYGATGLPIIVAVTSVAVDGGYMTENAASLLVAGGAMTVLLLPMTAALLQPRSAAPAQVE